MHGSRRAPGGRPWDFFFNPVWQVLFFFLPTQFLVGEVLKLSQVEDYLREKKKTGAISVVAHASAPRAWNESLAASTTLSKEGTAWV